MEQLVITLPEERTSAAFIAWLSEQKGVKLIVIEGFPTSGKTTRAKAAGGIDLDDYRPTLPSVDHLTWVEHVLSGDALQVIEGRIVQEGFAVVAGVAAWPVLSAVVAHLGDDEVRRVFVQRITVVNGQEFWDEATGAAESAPSFGKYIGSYYGSVRSSV